MTQFVYVLEDKNTHLLKIGISLDPEFRAKQVGKEFGTDVVVAGVLKVDDARRTEQFLHSMFSERRVVGEWFELTEKQKGYLLAYFIDKPQKRDARGTKAPPKRRPPALPRRTDFALQKLQGGSWSILTPDGMVGSVQLKEGGNSLGLEIKSREQIEALRGILDALDLELVAVPKKNV
ncbi:GIY-YIG nuclease family protein [Deinococcus hopiensis]|uniref:T5orf172 domain-containing protein n=1 Tax=Deinococcus hopiensis KR-140 TaxID=695939 RepID=A0A1W1VK22_9DEIO|nr:GIY-YIG nuclease family protein [Deinococcus hopiensis]SMB93284.1 T5orf172 domain-containing protein [Deinococcus hopiensis KR-140]